MVKLKAFTLFDSLIAVTITAIIMSTLSLSYGYLIDSDKPMSSMVAQGELPKLLNNLKESKAYFNESKEKETYRIEQIVEQYKGNTNLFLVTFNVIVNSKITYSEQHLVENEER